MNKSTPSGAAPALPKIAADWERWKNIVRESPAIRDTKIAASRQAVEAGTYDQDGILDETLDRMSTDMGLRLND